MFTSTKAIASTSAPTGGGDKRTMRTASVGLAFLAAAGCCCSSFLVPSGALAHRSLRWVPADYTLPGQDADAESFTRIKNGRKFLGYTSSAWEEEWLTNLDAWEGDRSICEHALSSRDWPKMMRFLEATCSRYPLDHSSPWCMMDDNYSHRHGGVYYNRKTGQLAIGQGAASDLADVEFESEPRPLAPSADYEDIFSKFTYRDETTGNTYDEYIEPLVSHLRHPLAKCVNHPNFAKHVIGTPHESQKGTINVALTLARGYLLPPPPRVRTSNNDGSATAAASSKAKTYLFDAGASNWFQGAGGPSLSVLTELWKRNGMSFDDVRAFEGSTSPETFYNVVPQEWKDKTTFQQAWIRSKPDVPSTSDAALDGPFLPTHIASVVTKDDYVVFKLDIDSPEVEGNTVLHLLSEEGADDLSYIDEFFWEHHVTGNYLMRADWGTPPGGLSIRDSADLFLRLRKRGVRAHSWV